MKSSLDGLEYVACHERPRASRGGIEWPAVSKVEPVETASNGADGDRTHDLMTASFMGGIESLKIIAD